MDFGNALGIFAAIFGFIALAGGAAGYFKAARGDSIIKYQATEIDLRNQRIADNETALAKVTESCNAKDETIAELRKHNAYLQKLGQGSPQLKKLTSAIENQTKLMNEFIKKETKK
jgi:hypothetical protein